MENIKKIQKVLELKANCNRLEQCVVCGMKTESCFYYDKSVDKAGQALCKECNNLQITENDVKGNYLLEHLYKRVYGK